MLYAECRRQQLWEKRHPINYCCYRRRAKWKSFNLAHRTHECTARSTVLSHSQLLFGCDEMRSVSFKQHDLLIARNCIQNFVRTLRRKDNASVWCLCICRWRKWNCSTVYYLCAAYNSSIFNVEQLRRTIECFGSGKRRVARRRSVSWTINTQYKSNGCDDSSSVWNFAVLFWSVSVCVSLCMFGWKICRWQTTHTHTRRMHT